VSVFKDKSTSQGVVLARASTRDESLSALGVSSSPTPLWPASISRKKISLRASRNAAFPQTATDLVSRWAYLLNYAD
jgi:hypothetical protein